MSSDLKERRLSDLSRLEVRYYLAPSQKLEDANVLVIKYTGSYQDGCKGNSDAQFMCAMARAGIIAFEPNGVIHDLSQLTYNWGDMLSNVFSEGVLRPNPAEEKLAEIFGHKWSDSHTAQPAVVVGPACEEAVRTLLLGTDSTAPISSVGWVFRDLDSARRFIDDQFTAH
jgi:hypothetical protein